MDQWLPREGQGEGVAAQAQEGILRSDDTGLTLDCGGGDLTISGTKQDILPYCKLYVN